MILEHRDRPRIVSDFPCEVTEIEHVWIPMSDGVRLSAREGPERARPMVPGEEVEVRVRLNDCAHAFHVESDLITAFEGERRVHAQGPALRREG